MGNSTKEPGDKKGGGYCKPPVEHQWKKGQSGNPKGKKPAEAPDLRRSLKRALASRVAVPMNGRSKNSLLDVFAMKLAADGAKGVASARREIIRLMTSSENVPESGWTTIVARPVFDNEEHRLQEIAAENERLRQDNKALKARLAGGHLQLPPPFDEE